jgi:RNA polymerase sigma-70 factor (ECF subfamily)
MAGISGLNVDQTHDGKKVRDEALVRRAKAGDREAFGGLVDRFQAPVYRVVRGILSDPADAEDVAQEAFLRAYESLPKFRGESGFFTWLYRIAVNEALRARKRRSFARIEAVPEAEAPRPETPDEDGPSPAALERLLGKLSDEFRAIVVLRDLEGLSYQEIAETLEIPMGTVESRLFRARRDLRELWRKSKEPKNAV